MTTHIALEEGKDIEEVAQWPVRRKLFHAQMLGAYHEHRADQMDRGDAGYSEAADVDPADLASQANQDAAQTANVPSPDAQPQGGVDPADRREVTWDIPDSDIDWQFCDQCHGMFEPGEYDAHYEMDGFSCTQ